MEPKIDICDLVKKGGVYYDVPGTTAAEVYKDICGRIELPEGLSANLFCDELVKREQMMSTAVGNGIAIPHPRPLLLSKQESQRIVLCFPKEFLDMNAPDERLVSALFILLTSSVKDHLQILAQIADLVQKVDVRRVLERQAPEEEVLAVLKQYQ